MTHKPLPIGIDDFREMIEKDYYYIDKTMLIRELEDSGSKCTLLPRPRRFGKTLNLSMLRYFYEKTDEDTSGLFQHLAIWQQGETYTRKQGKHPVIFVTFKDVRSPHADECLDKLKEVIRKAYLRHKDILNSAHLDPHEKTRYREIIELTASRSAFESSLEQLSGWLTRCYGQKAIILIDEYDTPIQEGYLHGYYDEVIGFMRNCLGAALKGNEELDKAVLTGILRVAKESIFSGLNNLQVCSILDSRFSTCFGFLEDEAERLLKDYGIGTRMEEVRDWYNGYLFGETVIYNPWSLLNFAMERPDGPRPYWVNTSGNGLIRQLLTRSGIGVQEDLSCLMRGESIRKKLTDFLVYGKIAGTPDALWSFLLFSGYLKVTTKSMSDDGELYASLAVTNKEIRYVYREIILGWFEPDIRLADRQYEKMLDALVTGNIPVFEHNFREMVQVVFSYFDTSHRQPEIAYHAFSLGLLVSLRDTYEVKSNRESGDGRYDVLLLPRDPMGKGIVLEFKKMRKEQGETLEATADAALRQIRERRYDTELRERGVRDILLLGIAFDGKQVRIKAE